ncbi:toll-like receptor 2 type-2 [Saccostrea cucullata]|uniref:toll-like receptor 2 type-2 n=1 Tax=Saccostrea cuccullata TaxID=36930 RepID=UPI002ED034E7
MRENRFIFGDLSSTHCNGEQVSMKDFFQEKSFKKFEKECHATTWLTWSSVVLVLILTTILLTAFMKKYRVHIDYVILRLRSRWNGIIPVVNTKQFRFDGFVSYAEDLEDFELVSTTLYKELKRLGFEISLPDEDFIPGRSKAKQLLQCIDESRKVIIVITENFLASGWNSYAVQMVVTHAFHNHREKSIVVIIKDGISIEKLPKDLKYIWWSVIRITWPETEENMETFWEELSKALDLD